MTSMRTCVGMGPKPSFVVLQMSSLVMEVGRAPAKLMG